MKIFNMSDVHSLMRPKIFRKEHLETVFAFLKTEHVDVVTCAGDIGDRYFGLLLLQNMSAVFPDINFIYVLGNHEYYAQHLEYLPNEIAIANQLSGNEKITVFDGDQIKRVILHDNEKNQDVLFTGATLWTDLNKGSAATMNVAQRGMNDYKYIRCGQDWKTITPNNTINAHYNQKKLIFKQLQSGFEGPRVVVTHHLPYVDFHGHSGDALAYAYGSDFEDDFNMLEANQLPVYWFSGHTHVSRVLTGHYKNGDITFISNQMGYPHEFETGYTHNCIVEV